MLKKRKKAKKPTTPTHVDRLYKAVAHYVSKSGGSVVVIGGVQVQQWPGDGEFRYTIAIKCSGRKPEFKEQL